MKKGRSVFHRIVVSLLGLFLVGCTTLPDTYGYNWKKLSDGVPESKWTIHLVTNVKEFCPGQAIACAHVITGKFPKCDIYLPYNSPQWLTAHEERHCKGWTHG